MLSEGTIQSDHPLVEETDLSAREVSDAYAFLKRNGLIEDMGEDFFRLTKEGFEIARDQEIREQQVQNNRNLVRLTSVLALAAVVELATRIDSQPPLSAVALGVVAIVLLWFAISPLLDAARMAGE